MSFSPTPAPRVGRTRRVSEETERMAAEIRAGLQAREPRLPSKYFYDDRGSRLFEEITRLPEYYQTRTEEALLDSIAADVVRRAGARELVEIGSGAGRKIRTLLGAMRSADLLERCVLFDINEMFIRLSVEKLHADYPQADFRGVVGDFLGDLTALGPGGERLIIFLGGTVGNIERVEVPRFFGQLAGQLAPGDTALVGVDLVKDTRVLNAAYNDAAGVTAEFNLNILNVLNHRLDADFDLAAFEHVAFYDERRAHIEMRLRTRRACRVQVPVAGLELSYARGDEIRTEISCKYTRQSLIECLSGVPLRLESWYTDADGRFALALLRRTTRP